MTFVRRLSSISWRQWKDLAFTVIVLTVIEIGLRVGSLDRLAELLGSQWSSQKARMNGRCRSSRPMTAALSMQLEKVLRHWCFSATCLRRSLLAGHLLRRWHPVLRLGVAKVDGIVTAHAWLEINGVNLDPVGSASFEVIAVDRPLRQGVR